MLTVPEMVAVSSNVGFAKVFDRLGRRPAPSLAARASTSADAPAIEGATRRARCPTRIEDRSFEGAVVAIGEVLTASPLQVAAAYAALANGGVYVAPTFTRRTGSPPPRRSSGRRPRAPSSRMLEGAVDERARHRRSAPASPALRVAGKTGTAEWDLPGGQEGRYASFVGFVPAEAPRFVILVGVEHANDGPSGGEAAAPVFSRVAARALR